MPTTLWSDGADDTQVAEAMAAERASLSLEVRLDPAALDAYLADDFHEFGTSGREYHKAGTAERVAAYTSPDDPPIEPEHLRGRRIADGLVMLAYDTVDASGGSHRTSLWRRSEQGRWQMVHHQGTRFDGE